jgi:cell division protein FtsL
LVVAKRKPAYVVEPWRYPQREQKPQRVIRKKTGLIQKYAQVALVMFIFSVAVSVVGHYSVLTSVSYQTTRLQRELSSLKDHQHHLQLEAARLSSLDRIESIAKNELGMIYPDKNQHIFLTVER